MQEQPREDRSPLASDEPRAEAQANPYASPVAATAARPRHGRAWIVRHAVGWGSLALGAAGLVLPVLPGWVFIAWGLITLSPDIPAFSRLLGHVERKLPRLTPIIERVRGDGRR